jgi:hypothetical protein
MLPPDAGGEKEAGLAEAVHEGPDGVKTRIQLKSPSEMYTLPVASTARPFGAPT